MKDLFKSSGAGRLKICLRQFGVLLFLIGAGFYPLNYALADLPEPQTVSLIGGVKVALEQSPVAYIADNSFSCTGLLVGPSTVISAAHCVSDFELGKTYLNIGSELRYAVAAYVHPSYRPNGPVEDSNLRYDIGVLVLDSPVASVPPIPIVYDDRLGTGESFFVYGYGLTETSGSQESPRVFDDARGANFVVTEINSGVIRSDFLDSGAAICAGDSGGPALKLFGNYTAALGVSSYGSSFESEGNCAIDFGISGIVDLQSRSSQKFLATFADIKRISGRLARASTHAQAIRDGLRFALQTSAASSDLRSLQNSARDFRGLGKLVRTLVKDRKRRKLVDKANSDLKRILRLKDYSRAEAAANKSAGYFDQLVSLGLS